MADKVLTIDVPDDDLVGIADAGNQDRVPPKKTEGAGGDADLGIDLLKDQVATLSKEREEDRKKVEAAQRDARDAQERARLQQQETVRARREADSARTEGIDAQRVAIDNAIAAAKSAGDSAESEYAAAFEAGDAKKAATAQRKIAKAEAELSQLEAGKAALPERAATTTGRAEADAGRGDRSDDTGRREPQPQTEDERIDAYIRQFSAPAQRWLREHRECVTNRARNLAVMAADEEAVEQGLKRDSAEYFEYIDRRMGYAKDTSGGNGSDQDRRHQQRHDGNGSNGSMASRASAPVRGSTSNGGEKSTSVDLTEGEQRTATDGTIIWNYGPNKGEPIGVREYARRKLAQQKAGRFETPYA